MQPNNNTITPIEKIFSILSYITMGIFGLIILFIAYIKEKKLRFFLNYNIVQSIIIGVALAIFKMSFELIMTIFSQIKFLDYIAGIVNFVFSLKIIRIYSLNISFNIPELFVFILLMYIIVGIFIGRIFYIPYLTDIITKTVKKKD